MSLATVFATLILVLVASRSRVLEATRSYPCNSNSHASIAPFLRVQLSATSYDQYLIFYGSYV